MIPPTPESDKRRVEQLLRSASTYAPEDAPPADLALVALERLASDEPPTVRRRPCVSPVLMALFGGACAASATLALAFVRSTPIPAPAIHVAVPRGPVNTITPPQVEQAADDRVPRVAPAAARRHVRRRHRERPRIVLAARAASPRIVARSGGAPKVRWTTERVQHEETGWLANGWLVQADEEHGGEVMVPGIVELPTPVYRIALANDTDARQAGE